MKNLSFEECIPLIQALRSGVMTTGLQQSLEAFGEADSQQENLCARSISRNFIRGNDFQTSFRNANPKLPYPLTEIIIAGYLRSVLDHTLEDISTTLVDSQIHSSAGERLVTLVEKYNQYPTSLICNVCFERDFRKLLVRAETEGAFEVMLEQEGESFLHQKFSSSKLIHVIEPSHSLVYKTLLQKLESACQSDGRLNTEYESYQIKKSNLASYSISIDNKEVLRVVFAGIIDH
jgi:hypothetical protein